MLIFAGTYFALIEMTVYIEGIYCRGLAIELLQNSPKLPSKHRIYEKEKYIFCGYKFSRILSKTAKSAKINTNKVNNKRGNLCQCSIVDLHLLVRLGLFQFY